MRTALLLCSLLLIACSDSEGDTSDSSGGSGGGGGSGGSPASCEDAAEPLGTDPAAGQSFPDLAFNDCQGVEQSIKDMRCQSEILLLSVGAGWCMPCREETPDFQVAFEAHQAEGLGIVQVMFQDNASNPATTLFCENWEEEFSTTFPVLIDPVNITMGYFEQSEAPLNLVMDRDGKVLWSDVGKIDDVEALVTQYLNQ